MAVIKVKTSYNEYRNSFKEKWFEIVPELPEIGDSWHCGVVKNIYETHIDISNRDEAFEYDYYAVGVLDEDEYSSDLRNDYEEEEVSEEDYIYLEFVAVKREEFDDEE